MRVRPISPDTLVRELADRVRTAAIGSGRLRVAIDGPPPARPERLASDVVEALRAGGHPAVHVPASGFLRAASLRLERGRTDPDSYYEDWLDVAGLAREVLNPLGPDGNGRILPSLRSPVTDRATRTPYVTVPPGGAVIVSGAFLLGAGLAFDLSVHLALSAAALDRRVEPAWRWTLPAFARYAGEVMPTDLADVVIRADDVRHPALVEQG